MKARMEGMFRVRCPVALQRRINAIARRERRGFSDMIRLLLERGVAQDVPGAYNDNDGEPGLDRPKGEK